MADYMPPDPPAVALVQSQPVRNLVRRIVCDGGVCRVVTVEAEAPPLPMAGPTMIYPVTNAAGRAVTFGRPGIFPRVRLFLREVFPRLKR